MPSPNRASSSYAEPEDHGEGSSSRPIGRKAAKGKERADFAVVGLLKKQAKATQTTMNTLHKELKRKRLLLEEATNDSIMSIRLDGLDQLQANYIKARQLQIHNRFFQQQTSGGEDEDSSSNENEEKTMRVKKKEMNKLNCC